MNNFKGSLSGIIILSFLFFFVPAMALEIKSDAFQNSAYLSARYTCDSYSISPSLRWNGVPSGTKSFVLICEDPDAPYKTWTHWVIFNIPPDKRSLSEDVLQTGVLKDGTIQGINDFGLAGYGGPCPPAGKPHRYFFRLYALDSLLDLDKNSTKEAVLRASKGHVIAEAQIFAFYQRQVR